MELFTIIGTSLDIIATAGLIILVPLSIILWRRDRKEDQAHREWKKRHGVK